MTVAVISGSGFYDLPQLKRCEKLMVETPFGVATALRGMLYDTEVLFLSRHRKEHKLLSNHINHQANIWALKQWGAEAIVSTTVCGVLHSDIPLSKLMIFKDLYFPDNRLANGELCTMYTHHGDPQRGHYMFNSPFSEMMRDRMLQLAPHAKNDAVYAHVNGPRFNTKAEIEWIKEHAHVVSQTAGPEVVLAGELEMPIVLIGFGVDYANGVKDKPTPPEDIIENLKSSNEIFTDLIARFLKDYESPTFEGFVYRFE